MMKKVLLGTTALVGAMLIGAPAVVAAEKPSLALSGFARFEMEFVDQDQDFSGVNRGYNFEVDDWEVDFIAKSVADNGLEYGAKLEIQAANGNNATDTDEAMLWLEGNWGLIHMGREDGAEDLMAVAGWSIIGGVGAWDGEGGSLFSVPTGVFVNSNINGDTGDANKVSYYTPSFAGFRAGATWTPDTGVTGNEAGNDSDGSLENSLGVGLEYKNTFGDVGVHVSGRYTNAETEVTNNDVTGYGIGAKLTYAGFALAGSYHNGDDEADGSDAPEWWDVALSYSTGPYSIGVGYFNSTNENNAGLEGEADYFAVTGGYTVAPGLKFYAEWDYVEMEGPVAGTSDDNDASAFIIGTQVSF